MIEMQITPLPPIGARVRYTLPFKKTTIEIFEGTVKGWSDRGAYATGNFDVLIADGKRIAMIGPSTFEIEPSQLEVLSHRFDGERWHKIEA